MQVTIEGVMKVNYQLTVDEDVFTEACEECGLNPKDYKKFTNDQWQELNPHLVQVVFDNESDIDDTEIHSQSTIFADTVTIDDPDHMTTVYYNQDRTFDSVEILQERNGGTKVPPSLIMLLDDYPIVIWFIRKSRNSYCLYDSCNQLVMRRDEKRKKEIYQYCEDNGIDIQEEF